MESLLGLSQWEREEEEKVAYLSVARLNAVIVASRPIQGGVENFSDGQLFYYFCLSRTKNSSFVLW